MDAIKTKINDIANYEISIKVKNIVLFCGAVAITTAILTRRFPVFIVMR